MLSHNFRVKIIIKIKKFLFLLRGFLFSKGKLGRRREINQQNFLIARQAGLNTILKEKNIFHREPN